MNLTKNYYLIWILIILTCLALGCIYYTQPNENNSVGVSEEANIDNKTAPTDQQIKQNRIEEVKNSLSIDQQIGQLILAKVPYSTDIIEDIQAFLHGSRIL